MTQFINCVSHIIRKKNDPNDPKGHGSSSRRATHREANLLFSFPFFSEIIITIIRARVEGERTRKEKRGENNQEEGEKKKSNQLT
jgi:hypothetical protein